MFSEPRSRTLNRQRVSERWIVRATGLGVALAVGLFLLPVPAAACDNTAFARHAAPNASPDMKSDMASHHRARHHGHKRPCNGPDCSRGPGQLPAAPLSLAPSTVDQWATVTPKLHIPEPDPVADFGDCSSFHPVDHPFHIERPPRAARPSV